MASSSWDASFDYQAESARGEYSPNYYDSNYLTAPQPTYTMSGATSPMSANSPQAATSEYTEDNATYSYPTTTWDVSGSIMSPSYSGHNSPTGFAGTSTFLSSSMSDQTPPPAFINPGSPTSVGSPTPSAIEYAYSGSTPSTYQFGDRGREFWSYYVFQPTGENGPFWRLQDHFQATDHFPRIIMHVEDPNQPQDTRNRTGNNGNKRFVCLYSGCDGAFKRSADLERHVQQVHNTVPAGYYCDYRRCNRSQSSPENSPFGRKDHYRDHLREYHHEDLPRRGGNGRRRSSAGSSVGSSSRVNIHRDWWRCTKCLARNPIGQAGTMWVCTTPECQSQCEVDRQRNRENMRL